MHQSHLQSTFIQPDCFDALRHKELTDDIKLITVHFLLLLCIRYEDTMSQAPQPNTEAQPGKLSFAPPHLGSSNRVHLQGSAGTAQSSADTSDVILPPGVAPGGGKTRW